MAQIEVSGFPGGPPTSVTEPLNGRPWADVTLGTTSVPWQPGDQVQLAVQDGPVYRMVALRVGPRGGFARVRLVAGTGGLSQNISSKFYRAIPAKTVVQEILDECGEQVGDIDLPGTLPAWVRPEGPAHEALRAVMMRYPERVWRMAPDGVVGVGVPKWPEYSPAVPVIIEDAAAGTFTVGFSPQIRPGDHVTLTRGEEEIGKRITRVTHTISQEHSYPRNITHVRTILGTGDGEDGGPAGLDAAIQRSTRWTDYCAFYPCEVLRDHGNHELDLRPEHPLLPELTRVRLVQPFAGAKLKIKAGGSVLLGFQNADPSRPVALFHAATQLEKFSLTTGRGQTITVDDDRGEVSPEDALYLKPHIRLTDAAGQQFELWAQPGKERVSLRDKSGSFLLMDGLTGNVTLSAAGTLTLSSVGNMTMTAPQIIQNGVVPVARLGDAVQVNLTTGTGTIISASTTVKAG